MELNGTVSPNRVADVICQHTRDGTIIPLKIRLQDEDGEFQTYQIRAYKNVSRAGQYTLPNEVLVVGHIWTFECKIAVFDRERVIRLCYNARENIWTVPDIR